MKSWMIALVVLGCVAGARAQSMTWELRDGRWQQLPKAPATQAVLKDPELDRCEAMLADGRWKPAKKALLVWEKANKGSPLRDRALFLIAQADYQGDDRIKSF